MQSNDGIAVLVGKQVTSVEFVHDYLQFHFDDLHLTVNAPLSVATPSGAVRPKSEEFNALLRTRVGHLIVEAMTEPDKAITLRFDDNVELRISLIPDEQVGPEAAVLSGGGLDRIYVW